MKQGINEIAGKAALELSEIELKVSEDQIQGVMHQIETANRIFVCGAGRSLLMLRAFAMRLMHIGYEAFVVGDTTTPAFEAGDMLIVGSASGETTNLVSITKRAKELGGTIAVVSIFEDSTLARLADSCIRIPAFTDKLPESDTNKRNTLSGGSMFEIGMVLMFDAMVLPLAEKKEVSTNRVFARHANLE
ncbi:MAG: 6-phospho-3-hexuloisomerase [Streptococcaceae bacterium]|jgi:6-phospho-3-hexuloisomerase|nr:6-phospho-3-hexuloisomerase [Streptococcaceae bacterium]